MSSFSINRLAVRSKSALMRRAGWAASAAIALTLAALTLAGPAVAAPTSPSPANVAAVNTIIATIPLPANAYPEFLNVDPVRGAVWTTGPYTISEISEQTNRVIQTFNLTSGNYPSAMAVDPTTGDVLLGNTDGTLTILNPRSGAQTLVNVGNSDYFFARGVAVDPTTGLIYVTDTTLDTVSQSGFSNSQITVVNEHTGKVVDQIFDPNTATAATINPITHLVYVSNANPGGTFDQGSSIWVINELTNHVINTIDEPSGYPDAMALDLLTGRLFVTNYYNGPLTVINTFTNKVTDEITLGSKVTPYGVTADSANGMVYVDNDGGTQVWVVNERTNAVVDTITVPVTYGQLDVDPLRGVLYQNSDLEAVNEPPSTVEAIRVAP
jgi:YVTN family beta-propeller protein